VITYTFIDSPLGKLLLTSRESQLSGLYFADEPPERIASNWVKQDDADIFIRTRHQLREYASGQRQRFDLPLGASGTVFQVSVWNIIQAIPFGRTISYSELAKRAGRSPKDSRAVGIATGQNPICWIIPCHRVVGKDGSLTGYAGGIPRKAALLDFEAARMAGRPAVLALDEKKFALASR
jgi:methylated-DNA-[protein]-cysteine S-methyltransferase